MDFARRNSTRLGIVALILAATTGLWLTLNNRGQSPVDPVETMLPPVRSSPFQNSKPNVAYLGMQACIQCHEDAHSTYNETGHSNALAEVNLANEPSGGTFTDLKSQKTYRIFRQDGKMLHEESIRTADGDDLVLSQFPVKYTIGSGRFSRSYLIDVDGFLYESPATWYSARPGWALSPGYDKYNSGFQRPVEFRCLFCHAGRMEPVDNSPQRVRFHALTIDCERCHGPGALHVAKWLQPNATLLENGIDDTIVNPAHLERDIHEDICAQCHLHGGATVELPGRQLQDFRPGLRLADFATHYGPQTPTNKMQVVGHVEQMHRSRCYLESGALTCTTCHHPHARPSAENKEAYYRGRCLSCHTELSCSAPEEYRYRSASGDNCVTCHMPQSDTEIPHFAFTHHWIGIHDVIEQSSADTSPSELVPLSDISQLPEFVQERDLGLAYLQFSDGSGQKQFAAEYRRRAFQMLTSAETRNPGDSEVEAALARLYWGSDANKTLYYAELARQKSEPGPDTEATITFTIGSTLYAEGRLEEAIPWLKRTTTLRPTADVWYRLSRTYLLLHNLPASLDAGKRAAMLGSDRPLYVSQLRELFLRMGDRTQASLLEDRMKSLLLYRQQVD